MARLALVLPRFSRYGGVERFAFRLSEELAKRGHAVDFLCARAETEPAPRVRVVALGRPRTFRWVKILWFVAQVARIQRNTQYDLVISLGQSWNQDLLRVGGGSQQTFWHLSERAWHAGLPRYFKRLRRKLSPANWLIHFIEHRQYHSGCRIVCVSDAVSSWLHQDYPNLPDLEIIYNLPDLRRFSPPSLEEHLRCRKNLLAGQSPEIMENAVCIGTATSNFILKGTDVLIRALAKLPKNFRLYVAGGRSPHMCRNLASQLGVADQVVFLGQVDAMREFYYSLDIFALPSFYDACSNAVLEAGACGLPVLSTSSNGSSIFLPPECVMDDPADAEKMANLLLELSKKKNVSLQKMNVTAGMDAWLDLIEEMITTKKQSKEN